MGYEAKIIADSMSPASIRLTTFEVTFPRIVLAEFNTHRVFSRNSASSRAIPVAKSIEQVKQDPFIPEVFYANQKGMQAEDPLTDEWEARDTWESACNAAIAHAETLEQLGLHKSLANRILEPFKWHTVIVTATDWSNFFALRCDPNAQAEIRKPAEMMRELYEISKPTHLSHRDWHLPYVSDNELFRKSPINWDYWKDVSVGRCARVSYLTHDGVRDPDKDVELASRLKTNGHMSPFEHVARPIHHDDECFFGRWSYCGNFCMWHQYRKDIPHEDDFSLVEK